MPPARPASFLVLLAWAGVLLAGCAPAANLPAPDLPAASPSVLATAALNIEAPTATPTAAPSITPSPSATPTAAPTATPTPLPAAELCSPLADIPLAEIGLPDLLKNPFEAPRPGMDDGHYGADFAYWSRGERASMRGLPMYAVLAGKVAGRIVDRMPYGNMVIIETPLDWLPPGWVEAAQVPTPAPTVVPAASLVCPPPLPEALPAAHGPRSLYLLYAHLNQPPPVQIGQPVTCGEWIGEVGTTGRSVNDHLHLETRVGPSGATFTELAHYDNTSTENERRNYCTWRVSGLFQAFDPMQLLSLQP